MNVASAVNQNTYSLSKLPDHLVLTILLLLLSLCSLRRRYESCFIDLSFVTRLQDSTSCLVWIFCNNLCLVPRKVSLMRGKDDTKFGYKDKYRIQLKPFEICNRKINIKIFPLLTVMNFQEGCMFQILLFLIHYLQVLNIEILSWRNAVLILSCSDELVYINF